MTEVPCIFVEDLTEEQKRAYILADNKLSDLSGWDYEILEEELAEINLDMSEFGFDNMGVDFNHIEDLISTDFIEKREDKSEFSMTFIFPSEKREIIDDFVKMHGKEEITAYIIELAEGGVA